MSQMSQIYADMVGNQMALTNEGAPIFVYLRSSATSADKRFIPVTSPVPLGLSVNGGGAPWPKTAN